jgi:hypothetical protein
MTNTEKHDPWALLREARETMRDFAENWDCDEDAHKYRTTCRVCAAKEAKGRIDAALEAHAATPTPAMPEWTLWERLWYDAIIWKIRDFRQGVTLSVKPSRPTDGFYWSVKQFGQKPTEDEAKAAAVECARRLP